MLEKVSSSTKRPESVYIAAYTPMLNFRKVMQSSNLKEGCVVFVYTQEAQRLAFVCYYKNGHFHVELQFAVKGTATIFGNPLYRFAEFDKYFASFTCIQDAESYVLNLFEQEDFKLKLVRYDTTKLSYCDRNKVEL